MNTIFKKIAKRSLSLILAIAVIICSLTVSLSAFAADEDGTISFKLDANTNGGTVDGLAEKVIQIAEGNSYSSDVTVTVPEDGQQFIGWSTDKNDYIGEFTFTPKNGATYYAIFAEIIYVGDTVTNAEAAQGSKENPYPTFSSSAIPSFPFYSSATNNIVVLNGTATIASISSWAINADKRLYITGIDPITGVKNTTSVKIQQFVLAAFGSAVPVFGLGVYMDNLTITSTSSESYNIWLRAGAKNFRFGPNIVNQGTLRIGGIDGNISSMYVETGMNIGGAAGSNSWFGMVSNSATADDAARVQVEGDATYVINGGLWTKYEGGVWLAGTVGGNLSVVVNDYDSGSGACLRINTNRLISAGSINYIFNNGSRSKPLARAFRLNASDATTMDSSISTKTQGGFYYIDSGEGGKVMPTETAGKFKVEFDEGYNYITVNGVKTQLDGDNCFTIASTDTVVFQGRSDNEDGWTNIAYGYEEIIPEEPDVPDVPDEPDEPENPTTPTTISFTLDAATNGGKVDGGKTTTVEVASGSQYTSNVAVTPPTGLTFIGWSLDKDDFVGELTFTPKSGATYYAIYGHVIYVDAANGKTSAEGGNGTKANPYKSFSASGVPFSNFQNTSAENCVVVLKGAVAITSISSYTTSLNKRLYITGLDPTTGVLNSTNVTLNDFATGLSNQTSPIFKRGLYLDYITVADASASSGTNGKLYVRGNVTNLYLGANVEASSKMYVGGADKSTTSAYIETSAKNLLYIDVMNQKNGITFSGNSTVVINGGNITHNDMGVQLGGTVTGNSSVVVNDYNGTVLSINTAKVERVGGAINYIFNYGTRANINTLKLNWSFVDSVSTVDTAVPTTGGFYYIDSAEGGRVLPTDVAGKFKVEFDSGYNHIKVNGTNVELDSDNCFTLSATSASTVTPSESDWVKITYYYEKVTFKTTVNAKSQLPDEIAGQPVTWTATANENFVVNDKNQIVGLKTGTGKVYGVSVVNGVAVDTEIDVSVLDYDASRDNFANNNFRITPTSTKNLYILTVTGGVLNPSTFKISGEFQLLDEVEVEGGIASGREFNLYCEDLYALTVEGTFITNQNTLNTGIYNLGASVEMSATASGDNKIKFVFRATAITPEGTTIAEGGKLPSTMVVSGSTVTPTNIGVFMIPEVLLTSTNVKPTLKSGFDINSDKVSINYSDYKAANVKIKYLADMTYDYSDFYATLTKIDDDMRYVRVVCIPYITYTKSNGTTGVLYGDSIIRSHDVANAEIHLTEEEVAAAYRDETEQRITEIKNTTSNIAPTGSGTRIYISSTGSDSNNGTTQSKPIKTISKLNSLSLPEGSVVYFKRGDVFRGQVMCQAGVTYTAYGDGAKPEVYASLKNYAESGTWDLVATNIYKYSAAQDTDVGMIVFNGGKAHGIKAVNKSGVNTTTGKSFSGYTSLDTHLHFYQDEDGYVYLYFMGGNPADVYSSIEFSLTKAIFKIQSQYNGVTIDNLVFRYTGSHAISGTTCDELTVQNCEFYWIGGGLSSDGYSRFGNGVEIWGGAENYTVRNCYFYQIYDAGTTIQYDNRTDTAKNMVMKNIRFENNVMEYCNYSIEYFLQSNAGGSIQDFYITGNHMWYAGQGLCSQRPDKGRGCHIMSWYGHPNPNIKNYFISNNIFAMGDHLFESTSMDNASELPQYSGNTYIQFAGGDLGRTGPSSNYTNEYDYDIFDDNVRKTIWDACGDKTATVIWVENN